MLGNYIIHNPNILYSNTFNCQDDGKMIGMKRDEKGENRQNKVEKNWVHLQEECLQEDSQEQKRLPEDNLPQWKNQEMMSLTPFIHLSMQMHQPYEQIYTMLIL
jgi:hypothetical protein